MGKHRRPDGEVLPLAEWVRVGVRMLDEINAAANREEPSIEFRLQLGDAMVAMHNMRRLVEA